MSFSESRITNLLSRARSSHRLWFFRFQISDELPYLERVAFSLSHYTTETLEDKHQSQEETMPFAQPVNGQVGDQPGPEVSENILATK